MRRADIEVPNTAVDMDSWERLACYPRSTFYPLSDHASTSDGRVTMPYFRTCSTCRSRSQAPLCVCTRRLVSNQPEGTFGRLRYLLGGDRPSQTPHQTVSPLGLGGQNSQGGISRVTPPKLAPRVQSLPPILHKLHRTPLSS